MPTLPPLLAGLLIWASASGCVDARPDPEPVQFASVHTELFAAGGTLTDAWADIDGDGDPDRFVGFNGAPSRRYRNDRLDGFADVAPSLGLDVSRSVRTSAWGDYDNDGDPDLLLGFAGEGPVLALFRNDGAMGFVNMATEAGIESADGATRQASWIDYDEDGDLDLFVAFRDQDNVLFRNDGELGFVDVTSSMGLAEPGRSVGAVWFDLGDGGLDLVVANMDGDANSLWSRTPAGFTATVHDALRGGGRALGDPGQGSVRPCAGDYDNDGDLDVSFANYGPNGLLRAEADGTFSDVAPELGLATDSFFDTCAWGDFDHDGFPDLYVNGTITGGTQYRDWLMRRHGGATFEDVTPPNLLALAADHGATWVDFDLDGDLDLALVGVSDEGMHALMQNLLRPEFVWHSLKVRVLDQNGHATHPGAEVRVYATDSDRLLGTRLVDTGSGYNSQSDLPVHFGLPGGQPVDVTVTVLGGGQRRTARISGVDPATYQGRELTVRIGRDGSIR
jgi:hypothetical protein